ncbi:protein SGT1 homolog isoform X2 [Polyodon spathula]|uniref:protein SGT1 homolog isoform X2 n=1 Tax=Polyodon spathula TaxID=7913 RepID=UPI001B7F0021|nr:protein SGT1 homolog isoform X2 [Polyodon spathula]
MATEPSFPDSVIDEDPKKALEDLTRALEQKADSAEWYCQRAYAHILVKNYSNAVTDAKKALEFKPNCATAFLRLGIAEYHLKNYQPSREAFEEGQKIDGLEGSFNVWIKRCEENMDLGKHGVAPEMKTASQKIKYDWYQTESQVIVTIMIRNAQKDAVNIQFEDKKLNTAVKLASEDDFNLNIDLLHPIVPSQCTFKIIASKIEIKMKKAEAIRWEKLMGEAVADVKHFTPDKYPSSSLHTRNWDKLVEDIKEEEKNEKPEGDAALNKLFQQIYSDGTDEVKRAMNKSFMESGGTVLSTNWTDVGKRKVEVCPPDDAEYKKF